MKSGQPSRIERKLVFLAGFNYSPGKIVLWGIRIIVQTFN